MACLTPGSSHRILPLNRSVHPCGPTTPRSVFSKSWEEAQIPESPTPSAGTPAAFSLSQIAKNSSNVRLLPTVIPCCCNSFLLYQSTLPWWMPVNTAYAVPSWDTILISAFGKALSQPALSYNWVTGSQYPGLTYSPSSSQPG